MIIRQCQYTTSPASLCHAHSCHTELHPSSLRMSGEMVTRIKLTALHDTACRYHQNVLVPANPYLHEAIPEWLKVYFKVNSEYRERSLNVICLGQFIS